MDGGRVRNRTGGGGGRIVTKTAARRLHFSYTNKSAAITMQKIGLTQHLLVSKDKFSKNVFKLANEKMLGMSTSIWVKYHFLLHKEHSLQHMKVYEEMCKLIRF